MVGLITRFNKFFSTPADQTEDYQQFIPFSAMVLGSRYFQPPHFCVIAQVNYQLFFNFNFNLYIAPHCRAKGFEYNPEVVTLQTEDKVYHIPTVTPLFYESIENIMVNLKKQRRSGFSFIDLFLYPKIPDSPYIARINLETFVRSKKISLDSADIIEIPIPQDLPLVKYKSWRSTEFKKKKLPIYEYSYERTNQGHQIKKVIMESAESIKKLI